MTPQGHPYADLPQIVVAGAREARFAASHNDIRAEAHDGVSA